MAGINKCIIVGNLGDNPIINQTNKGETVANISVATSEKWTDRNTNEQIEKTEWHRVSIFGKPAEFASKWLVKGSKVYVEGKLQTRKWQDKNGQDRYTTEIVVAGYGGTLQALDKKDVSQEPSAENFGYKAMPTEELEDIPF